MRITPRNRPLPRILRNGKGQSFGMGPLVTDAFNGLDYPRELCVKQRGQWVTTYPNQRHIDREDGPPRPDASASVAPVPLSRLLKIVSGQPHSLVTLDEDERTADVVAGYTWTPAGYGYDSATPETGLVPVYRLYAASSGDTLFTASATERATALAGSYADQGVGFYAFATVAHNRKALYRAVTAASMHLYTADAAEYGALASSYTREGVLAYVLTGPERSYS